jgi:hypothetical protein
MRALVEVATWASKEDVLQLVSTLAEAFEIKAAFVRKRVDAERLLIRTLGKRTRRNALVSVIGIAVALALSGEPAAAQMDAPDGPRGVASADPAGLDHFLARAAAPDPLPSYHISIEAKPLRKLLDYRARIYDLEFLPPGERLWVRAAFDHDGERYAISMRIRGDLPEHWRGEQHSYRVKFKDRLLGGKKEISLILPWDKQYGVELLQTRICEELGLPYFPGRFVNLGIIGHDAGLYYESEHPTREYLERSGRPASSIFTFASNWPLYLGQRFHLILFEHPGSRAWLPLEGAGQIKQRATYDPDDPTLAKKQLAYVMELHRLLYEGTLEEIAARADGYLDLENFARYVAIQNFFGSQHAMFFNDNVRLYLDPTAGKFEFMPWDTKLMSLTDRLDKPDQTLDTMLVPGGRAFQRLFQAIPGLWEHKDAVLRRLVEDGAEHRAELNRMHAELIALYPDDERLREDASRIDETFRGNLELLERYLARAAADPAVVRPSD